MVRLISTRCSGRASRASTTAPVAVMSDSSTKKCHGCRASSLERDGPAPVVVSRVSGGPAFPELDFGRRSASVPLIEVAELIVQFGAQRRVVLLYRRLRGINRCVRPPTGDDHRGKRADDANEVGKPPGKAVESLVDGPREDGLGAVVRRERRQH